MNHPTVSIIVPTLNRGPLIGRMIDSVLAQTMPDWELLIIDGGSNDETKDVVAARGARAADRIRLIIEPGLGCCAARNLGIAQAKGQYVAFLDSDDEFLPQKLERQLELFRLRPELGLVYCDYAFIDLTGRHHPSMFDEMSPVARSVPATRVADNLFVCPDNLFDYLIRQYFIATIVGLVRRELLQNVRFLENDLYGCEWMFYLDIVRKCRAGFVDEPLCLHHHVAGSISRTSSIRNAVYHRSLLNIMRHRFADASTVAKQSIDRQLAETNLQLGYDSYRAAEFGPAVRYFAQAARLKPSLTPLAALLQSAAAWLKVLGKPGAEPILRRDPHKSSRYLPA